MHGINTTGLGREEGGNSSEIEVNNLDIFREVNVPEIPSSIAEEVKMGSLIRAEKRVKRLDWAIICRIRYIAMFFYNLVKLFCDNKTTCTRAFFCRRQIQLKRVTDKPNLFLNSSDFLPIEISGYTSFYALLLLSSYHRFLY